MMKGKIFEAALQKGFDSRSCDQLMAQFLVVFDNNKPADSAYINLRDLYKWLGDGTTATSQHFWRWLGSHTNPKWHYQNTMILQELSATQLPHFIAGLRANKTELVGRWSGDEYALAVLQQAIHHGAVNRLTLPILANMVHEIDAALALNSLVFVVSAVIARNCRKRTGATGSQRIAQSRSVRKARKRQIHSIALSCPFYWCLCLR